MAVGEAAGTAASATGSRSRRGFRFELGDDDEGLAASRVLTRSMFDQYAGLPARWIAEIEPDLEPRWRRQAGLSNTPSAHPRELADVEAAIEQVLAPYVTARGAGPAGPDPRRCG